MIDIDGIDFRDFGAANADAARGGADAALGVNTTAAAITGPANGPMPTSSTPAMCSTPARHSTRSKFSMASRRVRSALLRS